MTIHITIDSSTYRVDLNHPIDISIPLDFHGEQPNAFGVPKAAARAYEDGNWVGDTRRGGSCNFEELKLIPHCNGTHTEGVGHIARERISINTILTQCFILSTLITVKPEPAGETADSYDPVKNSNDLLITRKTLSEVLNNVGGVARLPLGKQFGGQADPTTSGAGQASRLTFLGGLIIRTLPNDESKKSRNYMAQPPPFFSLEAMRYIVELGVEHLLIDVPSLERTFDEGKLNTHRLFWHIPPRTYDINPHQHSMKTVTEMIYIPNDVPDGRYLLTIQIPPFVSDAAPSRPILYLLQQ
jgi:arylformamidase